MNIDIPDELIREGIALGTQRALQAGIEKAHREFMDEFHDCLSKAEASVYLGVSERTIEALWQSHQIPKDTALGAQLPRTSLRALKEFMAASRIKARTAPKPLAEHPRSKAA